MAVRASTLNPTSPARCVLSESNVFAFISYVSAADKGYFYDPHLASIKARHQNEFLEEIDLSPDSFYSLSPLSNRNTYVRVLLKRTLITTFLKNFKDDEVQIISLGSGLDTFAFQLFTEFQSSLPPIRFVELDLLSVVEEKLCLIQDILLNNAVFDNRELGPSHCRAWKAHPTSLHKSFYHLQSCDLRDLEELRSSLSENRIDFSRPTLILAEIVLVYLEPKHSDGLVNFFAERFSGPCCFLDFDHVNTEEEFGTNMKKAFTELHLPLLGIEKYPSIDSHVKRFTKLGWDYCTGLTMYEGLQKRLSKENMRKLEDIEYVDERERSRQILSHYGIIHAAKGFKDAKSFLASMDLEECRDQPPY